MRNKRTRTGIGMNLKIIILMERNQINTHTHTHTHTHTQIYNTQFYLYKDEEQVKLIYHGRREQWLPEQGKGHKRTFRGDDSNPGGYTDLQNHQN